MLIVVEGLDGSGKSTQVQILKKHLEDKGEKVHFFHFPRYDVKPYGELIAKFLRGEFGPIEQVHPQIVALLFAEDRNASAPLLREILEKGGIVLLDRYVYSNIAYQCAKLQSESERQTLKKWILELEYNYFNLPKPDLNIFLDVPLSFIQQNLSGNRTGNDRTYLSGTGKEVDIHEANTSFQKKVYDIYCQQVEEDAKFICIKAYDNEKNMLPKNETFEKIKDVVEKNF